MNSYILCIILTLIIILRILASCIIASIYLDINIKNKKIFDKVGYFIIFILLPEILLGKSISNIYYKFKINRIRNRVRIKNLKKR